MPVERLRPGDMRTRIEIMRGGRQDDGRGGFQVAPWAVQATVWAEVQGQNGREALIAKTLEGVAVYRIRIRFRADLQPSDQIRMGGPGGTDLNIASAVDPNGDREQLLIIASTESAQKTS